MNRKNKSTHVGQGQMPIPQTLRRVLLQLAPELLARPAALREIIDYITRPATTAEVDQQAEERLANILKLYLIDKESPILEYLLITLDGLRDIIRKEGFTTLAELDPWMYHRKKAAGDRLKDLLRGE